MMAINQLNEILTKDTPIELIHKTQNAPVPYSTMFHSEQKCAHFCSGWSIVGTVSLKKKKKKKTNPGGTLP